MGDLQRYALLFIAVIAVAAIVYAFVVWSGVQIPSILLTIFWIVIGAIICALAVKIVVRIIGSP